MKTSSTVAFLVFLAIVTVHADEVFPVIGKSYRFIGLSQQEHFSWPFEGKIVKRGEGMWCLIEFKYVPSRKESSQEEMQTSMWINLAVITSADEIDDIRSNAKSGK
jgi:hypothetical protein